MTLDVSLTVRNSTARLTLAGEADSTAAPHLATVLDGLSSEHLLRLELDLSDLTYLSSAGLRCLVFAHQLLGRSVEIVVINPSDEVRRTIELTGFDRSLTVRRELNA